jgi:hypothetical protein
MDRDGFMRSLAGLDRYMTKHIYNWNQWNQWTKKSSIRQAVKGIEKGKEKPSIKLYHQRDIVEQYGQVNMK